MRLAAPLCPGGVRVPRGVGARMGVRVVGDAVRVRGHHGHSDPVRWVDTHIVEAICIG